MPIWRPCRTIWRRDLDLRQRHEHLRPRGKQARRPLHRISLQGSGNDPPPCWTGRGCSRKAGTDRVGIGVEQGRVAGGHRPGVGSLHAKCAAFDQHRGSGPVSFLFGPTLSSARSSGLYRLSARPGREGGDLSRFSPRWKIARNSPHDQTMQKQLHGYCQQCRSKRDNQAIQTGRLGQISPFVTRSAWKLPQPTAK